MTESGLKIWWEAEFAAVSSDVENYSTEKRTVDEPWVLGRVLALAGYSVQIESIEIVKNDPPDLIWHHTSGDFSFEITSEFSDGYRMVDRWKRMRDFLASNEPTIENQRRYLRVGVTEEQRWSKGEAQTRLMSRLLKKTQKYGSMTSKLNIAIYAACKHPTLDPTECSRITPFDTWGSISIYMGDRVQILHSSDAAPGDFTKGTHVWRPGIQLPDRSAFKSRA